MRVVGMVTRWSARVADGVGEGAADGVGAEEDVGVGEEEVVGGGLAGGEGHGVGLAEPAGREFGDVEGAEFCLGAQLAMVSMMAPVWSVLRSSTAMMWRLA